MDNSPQGPEKRIITTRTEGQKDRKTELSNILQQRAILCSTPKSESFDYALAGVIKDNRQGIQNDVKIKVGDSQTLSLK